IDIATTATPEQVIELAAQAGLRSHPTGLQHGTVTVVSGASAYEVTTLRVDVDTDGRHATVEFTDQWEADAQRRDFTINALFCDRTGKIHDYVDGLKDLEHRRIRFVGDAETRIREDYLRILRFFRFQARFGDGAPQDEALEACIAAKQKLASLSRERVRQELLKLLVAPMAVSVLHVMERHGFLELILPAGRALRRFERLARLEGCSDLQIDPVRRLAALSQPASGRALQEALKLSNEAADRLDAIAALPPVTPRFRDAERQTLLYWHGSQAVIDRAMLAWAESDDAEDDDKWHALVAAAQTWSKPVFPVRGKDLLEAGLKEGQELGQCLQALEDWWVAGGFSADKAALMSRLAAIRR
ncbi:MAG: CCA tRNA nucleotidyltransferase, partial [Pseudomonadota bacterium]